jgi:hypothetical protein
MKIHSRFFMSFRLRLPESDVRFGLNFDLMSDGLAALSAAPRTDHILYTIELAASGDQKIGTKVSRRHGNDGGILNVELPKGYLERCSWKMV